MEEILKKLNKGQKKAVEHKDGPLLIVAGAGTGKTMVLVSRLYSLIHNKHATADEILLLTFTEKAAGEMEDRALKVLPYGYVDLWINTFHGFCERVLREHALDIGLDAGFKLLNTTDQWIFLRKNLEKFNLDYYSPLGNPNKFLYELVKYFSKLKDEYIKPEEYLKYAEELKQNSDNMLGGTEDMQEQEVLRINELANAYHTYNHLMLQNSYLDFGDLINYTIDLFRKRPNILEFYKKKFKYVMVDEFQDTNWAQYELVKLLLNDKKSLMVVGDDNQSIYKFRGASLSNIMQFKDDFPEAQEAILNKNYRSGQKILDIAYQFIQNNNPNTLEAKLGISKELESQVDFKAQAEHFIFEQEQAEVEWVAERIAEIYRSNQDVDWSDFAILVRSNSAADIFTQELKRKNIPNLFVSLRGLYHKPIILDCIAYFKLLDNYHESSALFRVLNMEVFKVSHHDIIYINKFARKKVWSLFEALRNINAIPDISPEAVANINKLMSLLQKHSQMVQDKTPSKIFVNFIWDAGLNTKDHNEYREYYSYLNQFYQKIKSFEKVEPDARLKDFMQLLDMEQEAGDTGSLKLDFEDDDVVKIMTVHASKGLEFDYVFLPGLVDKRFPTINRKDKIDIPDSLVKEKVTDSKDAHIEEERRLFYVALTRAKKELFLSSAKDCGGAREKKPSAFIEEAGLDASKEDLRMKTGNELLTDLENLHKEKNPTPQKYNIPTRFSFSQIEAYSNCPLQYKFNFILKIPVLAKDNFIFGRVIHNTLKDFLTPCLSTEYGQADLFGVSSQKKVMPTKKDMLEAYKKNWINDGYETKEIREEYKKKGMTILRDFYNNIEKEGWPEILFLEKSFSVRIGDYFFRGAIDRIDRLADGTIEIIDYKTGNPKEKLDAKSKRQLILYKIVAEDAFGMKASKLSFYYLENNTKVSFEAKDKDVEKLKLDFEQTIAKIKTGDFTPKPGMLCAYCDFRGICEFRK